MQSFVNDFVGEAFATPHALSRWDERGGESSFADSFKRAIPFGGQHGCNLLLEDGNIVFATKKKADFRLIKTVLTRDQAIASMEMVSGGRPHSIIIPKGPVTQVITKTNVAAKPKRGVYSTLIIPPAPIEALDIIFGLNDQELAIKEQEASGMWKAVIQRERGRRSKEKRLLAHVKTTENKVGEITKAMRAVLSEEQLQMVFQKQRELRQEPLPESTTIEGKIA